VFLYRLQVTKKVVGVFVRFRAPVTGMVVWRFQITRTHNVDYLGVAFADEGISLGGFIYQLWSESGEY
jgi:hypothetical protein